MILNTHIKCLINQLLIILRTIYSVLTYVKNVSIPEYSYISLSLLVNLDNLRNSHYISSSEKYWCLTACAAVIRL